MTTVIRINAMTPSSATPAGFTSTTPTSERASVRTILLLLVVFALGLGGGVFLYRPTVRPVAGEGARALSDATKTVLSNLNSPVELRFYALLDPASASDSLPAFAGRVGQLLSAYQREAGGKITVSQQTSPSDSAATAAARDGLRAFNLDQGDACFLGITVVQNAQKESLAQLSPEWEAALESDLTRAIVRVLSAQPSAPVSAETAQSELAATEAVKSAIPNLPSVPLEEGTRRLRETALKDFQAAVKEMESQVKEAKQRLDQAQNGGSEAEQQAARQHLQQVQTEQTRKIQQVAGQAQAQIAAWERLKGAATQPAAGDAQPPGTTPKR